MATAKKLANGKWECSAEYTDASGKLQRKTFTAGSQEEAERLSESYKKRLSGGATATKRVERKEVDKKKTKITG